MNKKIKNELMAWWGVIVLAIGFWGTGFLIIKILEMVFISTIIIGIIYIIIMLLNMVLLMEWLNLRVAESKMKIVSKANRKEN